MRTKIVFLFVIMFCLVILVGCTTTDHDISKPTKINREDFFKKYCDIYVNKFQSNDLKS